MTSHLSGRNNSNTATLVARRLRAWRALYDEHSMTNTATLKRVSEEVHRRDMACHVRCATSCLGGQGKPCPYGCCNLCEIRFSSARSHRPSRHVDGRNTSQPDGKSKEEAHIIWPFPLFERVNQAALHKKGERSGDFSEPRIEAGVQTATGYK